MKKLLFLTTVYLFYLSPMAWGQENLSDIVLIVSEKSPAGLLTVKDIERIYLKRQVLWKDGIRIIPLNLPPQNEARIRITNQIIMKSYRELVEYWNEQHFKGVNPPLVVESEEAVKSFVRQVEGAIGYISRKNMEPGFKTVHILF